MTTVQIRLSGRSPLVLHNIRLADPDDPFAREIAAIAKKRNKTEDDRKAIARLEWFGGLYTDDEGRPAAVLPTANLRKCLVQAAKRSKQGAQLGRALHMADVSVPIVHGGPADLEALYADQAYHYRRAVAVSGARTMRTRPQFRTWRVEAFAELLDDVMDVDALQRIVEGAGISEGLAENRINGLGRFDGEVLT